MNAHPYTSLPRRTQHPGLRLPRRRLPKRPASAALRRSGRLLIVAVLGLLLPLLAAPPGYAVVAPASPLSGEAAAVQHPTDWIAPVPSPTVVRGFDPPEENWQAGHRGVDIAALPGEPIRAPAHGTVRYAGVVAGKPLVSVTVRDWVMSVENVDASVRTGDDVYPGHVIGAVSSPSHCDDGCVHVGVWPDGEKTSYVDPMPFFGRGDTILLPDSEAPDELPEVPQDSGRSGAGPWGGHQNGRIPSVALCALETAPGHLMRCDAARAFDEMSRAYQQEFGTRISVTDSYRDYDTQVILKRRKGRMAATPGTSNHGWGLAMDLGGGINRFGTAAHRWMQSNASRFGYTHPAWARQNGSLPEAWHWEYAGG
ncbi:D-alanyl-D-alanine carboxypeptidase family protein [Brevibacterium yomogidense]|uniref:D-alanyl-D-alanine carboxypeptidase family protein n=1 Tax=Brevibacterium yomogidense TaxID=946573 RepID=UPI0018DF04F9|nr:D-alanyl-D-alanine carboxypeptidase family protein [Brevibacterium yomogidense]